MPAVERVVRILRYLRDNKSAGVSQVAAALGIGRSPCFAILKTLQVESLVSFDERDKTYQLGRGLLELARGVAQEEPALAAARAFLVHHANSTMLSTFLIGPYSNDRLIVLDKEEPPVDIRITISVGTTTPIMVGASGKCFIAFMDEAERKRVLATHSPPAGVDGKRPTRREYREALRAARKAGYALVFDEAIEGANSVAAPIFDRNGHVTLVITVVGFSWSLPRQKAEELGRKLREAADRITLGSGGQLPATA